MYALNEDCALKNTMANGRGILPDALDFCNSF